MDVRNLNTPHVFAAPSARETWESRAAELRRRVLVSSGLWPMPSKTPLRPAVTSHAKRDDFTVENVAIETTPGFWLCGSVYRPKGRGPFPAVANPHGHWTHGRLQREPDVPRAAPDAKPPASGRADLVSLAVNLARQGMLVFAYDAVGYNDTNPFAHQQFAQTPESWLWGVSELGLQTWNSIRAVDYLCSRRDVDRARIGATGASGGGSQVFLLAAIDDRVKVSVPVNMVSSTMQGGCTCENGPALRVGTDNVELAALAAPRPQLFVSCTGDWTRDLPVKEAPAAQKVYALFGAEKSLEWVQFPYQHNYNVESREAATDFLRRHLVGKPGEPERPINLDPKELRVARPGGVSKEALEARLREGNARRVESLRKRGGVKARETLRAGMEAALSVSPSLKQARPKSTSVLLVGVERDPNLASWASALATKGLRVDTLALPPVVTNRDALWQDFYSTYNRTPVGDRVQAILDAAENHSRLVGIGDAGLWALLARAVAPDLAPEGAACDRAGFTDTDAEYVSRLYVPCLRALGGIETARFLASARPLVTFDGSGSPESVVARLIR